MLPISFVVDAEGFVFGQTASNTKPLVQINLSLVENEQVPKLTDCVILKHALIFKNHEQNFAR